MLTLYGSTMSRAQRVLWMLKELGVPYAHVETSFLDGSTRQPEYLRINPNGRVPAIEDDGMTMCESLAINLYLAKKHPGPLSPRDLPEEAATLQWTLWAATELEKPLLLAAANAMLFAPPERSPPELSMALAKLDRPWRVLDLHLATHAYLIAERFTVADLNVAGMMSLVRLAKLPIESYAHLDAWLDRCLERPAAADWKGTQFRIPRPPMPLDVLRMFV